MGPDLTLPYLAVTLPCLTLPLPYLTLPCRYLVLPYLTLPLPYLAVTLPCLTLPCRYLNYLTLPCLTLPGDSHPTDIGDARRSARTRGEIAADGASGEGPQARPPPQALVNACGFGCHVVIVVVAAAAVVAAAGVS